MEQAEMLRAASVAAESGFATLFIDLDGFKAINDRHGHEHGDMILVLVAAALHEVLRETDVAGRIGGDEFVACLAGQKDLLNTARLIALRIIERIGKIGDGVGASVGYTLCNASLATALQQADEAMYDAKKLGRNHAALYLPKPGAGSQASACEIPVPSF
jgi:diguanylate cyclase (GGDEF)-like protein